LGILAPWGNDEAVGLLPRRQSNPPRAVNPRKRAADERPQSGTAGSWWRAIKTRHHSKPQTIRFRWDWTRPPGTHRPTAGPLNPRITMEQKDGAEAGWGPDEVTRRIRRENKLVPPDDLPDGNKAGSCPHYSGPRWWWGTGNCWQNQINRTGIRELRGTLMP